MLNYADDLFIGRIGLKLGIGLGLWLGLGLDQRKWTGRSPMGWWAQCSVYSNPLFHCAV